MAPAESVAVERLRSWLSRFGELIQQNKEQLTELDAAIGDSDHGTNLARGMTAVEPLLADDSLGTAKELLTKVGMTLVSTVGGASGPLYGTFFLRMGGALGAQAHVTADDLVAALRAGAEGVIARGKAQAGDKTMVDVWLPALDALESARQQGNSLESALGQMLDAARDGSDATIEMIAHKGRASYLGERSIGHRDPGAASSTLLIQAAAEQLHA